jgi:Small Multidrug Resistance protein
MGSIYLLLSGAFEIGFTTCMKFDTWWGTILFLLFGFISFYMLTAAMKTLRLAPVTRSFPPLERWKRRWWASFSLANQPRWRDLPFLG